MADVSSNGMFHSMSCAPFLSFARHIYIMLTIVEDAFRCLKDELGFDGTIDYKNEDVKEGIKKHCPKGIDVYFDNVGGEIW